MGRTDVVKMRVAVDDVRDGLGGDGANGLQVAHAHGWERIDRNHAGRGDQEHGVVSAIAEPVEALPYLLHLQARRRVCMRPGRDQRCKQRADDPCHGGCKR